MADVHAINNRLFEVPFPPKPPIKCIYSSQNHEDHDPVQPALLFTHGAGGTLKAKAIVNFSNGFALNSPSGTVCFQGNMNLQSRAKMFGAVAESLGFSRCLGGRSMGARAAVMAATDMTTRLVLVSYPLHTGKDLRDQDLVELPASVKVVFVSGSEDIMCDLSTLENVRSRMKCQTWRVVVQGADHGMNLSPNVGTQDVGEKVGEVVAHWLDNANDIREEGKIEWDPDSKSVEWSGWLSRTTDHDATETTSQVNESKGKIKNRQRSLESSRKRKLQNMS